MNYPKTSFYSTLNTPVKNYSEREVAFVLEVKAAFGNSISYQKGLCQSKNCFESTCKRNCN